MNLESIQAALREAKLDGWLFYDHHRRDPIAYRVLGINPVMCTRRWYYLIPRGRGAGEVGAPDRGPQPGGPAGHGGAVFFLARATRRAQPAAARQKDAWRCNTPP